MKGRIFYTVHRMNEAGDLWVPVRTEDDQLAIFTTRDKALEYVTRQQVALQRARIFGVRYRIRAGRYQFKKR